MILRKVSFWILSLSLAVSIPAYSRLNETLEQCIQRYGKPVEAGDLFTTFKKGVFKITVHFDANKVDYIRYLIDRPENRPLTHFTKAQIFKLLNMNAERERWITKCEGPIPEHLMLVPKTEGLDFPKYPQYESKGPELIPVLLESKNGSIVAYTVTNLTIESHGGRGWSGVPGAFLTIYKKSFQEKIQQKERAVNAESLDGL